MSHHILFNQVENGQQIIPLQNLWAIPQFISMWQQYSRGNLLQSEEVTIVQIGMFCLCLKCTTIHSQVFT
jgi:galactitol-specific phosphotransferase system IIC component